jgi:hypothetical protein
MGKKPVISLRIYRGKQMSYDAQGNVQNENQLVKLVHDTKEWTNFMKNLISNGYLKVDVEDVKIVEKQKDEDGFIVDKISQYDNKILIIKEVDEVFKSHTTVPMSASDKKIADLEAKIDALLKIQEEAVIVKKPKVAKKETTTKVDKVDKKMMDNLRIDYADLNQGRKAFPGWDEVTLRGKIEELKKNQD